MNSDLIGFLENDKFASYIGIRLIKADIGYALAQMQLKKIHQNGAGIVHGGAIFSLADFAFAAAANSRGLLTLAIDCHISYFSSPKGILLTAEATEISLTKKLCNYNIDVTDEENNLVAKMSGTGYIKTIANK